ncbi:MAG: adenine deaminase [Firmicutes bacterium]|jgi:adenine deaminase|nr:adenine deaminase [Bacillota bacterium]
MIDRSNCLLGMARGDIPADLVFKNGRVVDVFSGKLVEADVAVGQGIILGMGSYQGNEEIDLEGAILSPGFIDGHCHVESSMLAVGEFARCLAALGTTTVFADPHEIANVAGLDGIRYLLAEGSRYPWNFFLMLPSCVPASPWETAGAVLEARDLGKIKDAPGVFGLGEVMNCPGVIQGDANLWQKLKLFSERFIDGHAPGVTGKELNAYLQGGIRADHEVTTPQEALEKVSAGMYVMIREGSAARNLSALLPAVDEKNFNRFFFATDDRHPGDLIARGHINWMLREATRLGVDPIDAIRLATINTATAMGVHNIGAIAPGRRADLLVLEDLVEFKPIQVYKDGKLVAKDGKALFAFQAEKPLPKRIAHSVHIKGLSREKFILPPANAYRVIQLIPDQIITVEGKASAQQVADLAANDLALLAVVERHHGSGRVGLGLIQGLGLTKGAIAASISHDSHHIIVAGLNPEDILTAVEAIAQMQGGLVVVNQGETLASLPLPIAGLMSAEPVETVASRMESLEAAAQELGVTGDSPFMTLSFMALPVIPALKLTDKGLVNVVQFKPVPLELD